MSIPMTGQQGPTTAGTAVSFTTRTDMAGTFLIAPSAANAGTYCFVGNDGAGDVTSANSAVLKKDTNSIVVTVNDLRQVYVDSDTDGDKVWWMRVMGQVAMIAPPAV